MAAHEENMPTHIATIAGSLGYTAILPVLQRLPRRLGVWVRSLHRVDARVLDRRVDTLDSVSARLIGVGRATSPFGVPA